MQPLRLRSEGLAWEVVEDEVVVLDLSSSEYFGLNATGTALWQALIDGATVGELVDRIVDAFDVSAADARVDVDAFLEQLRAHGLLAAGPE